MILIMDVFVEDISEEFRATIFFYCCGITEHILITLKIEYPLNLC